MNKESIQKTVDFAQLIRSSECGGLTLDFKSKLVEQIKGEFSEDEQKWFIANFYVYLQYHPTQDYPIKLDNVWDMIGFSTKGNAKRTLENNFTEGDDYLLIRKDKQLFETTKQTNEKKLGGAGMNEETILLNVDTFKNLCMITKTEKSKKIRKYYTKLEGLLNGLVNQQREEFNKKLQLLENENQSKQQELIKTKVESKLHKQQILLREFSACLNIVYIILVKRFEDGKYIIKIGESRMGITGRFNEHRGKYEECLLLDVFQVKRSKDFEKFLHQKLINYRYNTLLGHERETELFLVGDTLTYDSVIKLVNDHISDFNNDQIEYKKLELEIEKLKLENERERSVNHQLLERLDTMQFQMENLQKTVIYEFEKMRVRQQLKTTTNFGEISPHLGQQVQQINPETNCLTKLFNSVAEVSQTFRIPRSSITKAIAECTIYKESRWAYPSDPQNPTVVNIQETRALKKVQNNGYIAKLNKEKTEILAVYLDRQTASRLNNYNSIAYLDAYVKSGKIVNDQFYYLLYDTLSQDLKDAFLRKIGKGELVLYKNGGVGQFDLNNNLIREFRSKLDCVNSCEIGNKSLVKALSTGTPYNNYVYRYLEPKYVTT
jgi:phage anti-repressor protein